MVKCYITFSSKPLLLTSWPGFTYHTRDWSCIPSLLGTGNFPFPKFWYAQCLPST